MYADFTDVVICYDNLVILYVKFLSVWFFSDFLIDTIFLQQLTNLLFILVFWCLFLSFAKVYQRLYSRAKLVIFLWYHLFLSSPGKSVKRLSSGMSELKPLLFLYDLLYCSNVQILGNHLS